MPPPDRTTAATPAPVAVSQASRRTVLAMAGALLLAGFALTACLVHVPAFYGRAAAAATGDEAEARARRTVSKASAWHAALSRPGAWDTAITAEELNAWLELDLARNHPQWLPRGVTRPRIEFRPRHLTAGARLGYGPAAVIGWMDCEIVLRSRNRVTITVERARLGAIPLPTAPVLEEIARRLRRLGMVTETRRVDGRLLLAVSIPSTHDAGATSYWLESMAFTEGEWLAQGTTRGGSPRQAGAGRAAR